MRNLNSQTAGLAKEIFVQLDRKQQHLINSVAAYVSSVRAKDFFKLDTYQADVDSLEAELRTDRTEMVNSESQLSWPHPVALPSPDADDEVFISWTYDAGRKTYLPREVFTYEAVLEVGPRGKEIPCLYTKKFGVVRLMCLWICVFRSENRKRSQTVSAESHISRLQEVLVGLEDAGLTNEAINRSGKKLHSELIKRVGKATHTS